jgi:hypothetical protein
MFMDCITQHKSILVKLNENEGRESIACFHTLEELGRVWNTLLGRPSFRRNARFYFLKRGVK